MEYGRELSDEEVRLRIENTKLRREVQDLSYAAKLADVFKDAIPALTEEQRRAVTELPAAREEAARWRRQHTQIKNENRMLRGDLVHARTEMDEMLAWMRRALDEKCAPGDLDIRVHAGEEIEGVYQAIVAWRAAR